MVHTRHNRWFQVEQAEGETVLTFTRSDLGQEEDAQQVGAELLRLLGEGSGPRFVLDFGTVDRFSSSLLGKLVAFQRRVRQAGGAVAVRALSEHLAATLESTRLDRFFLLVCGDRTN